MLWAAAATAASAAPLFEPDGTWTTLETAHFRIYYTRGLEPKAKQVAGIAEDAHSKLVPYMQVEPRGLTEVVIADGYDELNSMATDSPHRAIWLWQTPPNPDEGMVIGRYDQWMRLLFIHEYTHILQFQHTPWLVQQANSALGGLLLSVLPQVPIDITLNLPDLLSNAPSFFTEGLAVHTESTFTPGGRGLEGDFEMTRRMAFLEDRVPSLDQVWGRYLLDWPMAGYEYTWGAPFIEHLTRQYGEDAPAKILKAYGVAPWLGFNQAVHSALGVGVEPIWDGMVAELRAQYAGQKEAWLARKQLASGASAGLGGSAAALPEPTDVTTSGRYHRHPTWDADGTLLYIEALKNKSPRLYADKRDGSERQAIFGKSTRSAAAVDARGRYIYYERDTEDTVKKLSSFRDLFVWDRQEKKSKRLTHRQRTFAPALSPDGKRLVAVTSGEGQSGLALFDTEGRLLKKWTADNNDVQFGNPTWSPDGRQIAVAIWQGGSRDLYLVDAESGARTPLWQDAALDFYPSWSPDGRFLVFSSDRTGIFNLFAYELKTRRLFQLTDVIGGAFDPAVSPDGRTIAFSNYTGRGYDIQTIPFAPAPVRTAEAPVGSPGSAQPAAGAAAGLRPAPLTQAAANRQPVTAKPAPAGKQAAPGAKPAGAAARPSAGGQPPATAGLPPAMTVAHSISLPSPPLGHRTDTPNPLPAPETVGLGGYNPLPTMQPSIWFPVLGSDERGNNLSLYTFWQDILRQHALTVIGGYGFNSQRLSYGMRYENNQLDALQWVVGVNEFSNAGRFPVSQERYGNLWQWNKSASFAFSYPGLRNPMFDPPPITGDNWTFGARTEWVQDYAFQADATDAEPNPDVLPANGHEAFPTAMNQGVANSLFLEWQHADAYKLPYDYGPMDGSITTAGVEQGLPTLGGNQTFTRGWADHRFFMKLPWGEKHSLGVRTTAGAVYGRNGDFFYSVWRQPFGYQPLSTINRWDLTSATNYDNRYVMLRGYNFLLGNRNLSMGLEYRFPIADVFRGVGPLPVFLSRWYGVAFWDNGFFWGIDPNELKLPSLADFKSGVGAELRAQTSMFQSVPIDVRFGLAYGLTAGGGFQPNFGLGTTF